MLSGRRVLAIVPARSGSVGLPDKNMRMLGGRSLIGRAGATLADCDWIDRRVLSTDSERYAEEGRRHGLDTPFLRPAELSTSTAAAIDVVLHALHECETADDCTYDVVLIIEPTSPLRTSEDVRATAELLATTGAESAVAVSPLDPKCHPWKVLRLADGGRLAFLADEGQGIVNRQELPDDLVYRNGVCYAVTRTCLLEKRTLITDSTVGHLIDRPVVNIDTPLDLLMAEVLLSAPPATDP